MSTYKLGDIVIIKKGRKAENTSDVYMEGSKRFIQIDDLRNNNKIKYTKSDGILATENDVLIAWDGANAGTVGYGLTGIIGSTIASLEIDKDQFIGAFIGKYLQSKFHLIRQNCTGATIPHVRRDYLLNIKVPNIDKQKQKQIVQTLDTADTLRQKRKEQLNLLDDYLKSVFFEMFGDPVENSMGWRVSKLNEFICHLTSGGRGWSKYYSATGARFIRSFDVQMNSLSDNDTKYVNPPNNKEAERTIIKPMDILLTITGSRIGRVAVMPNNIEEAYVSQHVAIIRVKNINQLYLSYYLSMPEGGQRIIQRQQYGQTKPGLSLEQIKKFSILYPPIELQNKFASIVGQVEQAKQKMHTSLDEMDNHFNALMQMYFG